MMALFVICFRRLINFTFLRLIHALFKEMMLKFFPRPVM